MEVQKIQTILEKVQAQISNLEFRHQEICALSEQVDWTDCHWRNYSLLLKRIADEFKSMVSVFSDSVLCLGEKCPDHPDAARIFGK